MTRPAAGGRRDLLALPVLAAALAAFGGVLTGGALYYRDIALLHRPVRLVARAAWSAGRLPVWDPLMDGGRPLLANPNHRLLHPTALLDGLLDVDRALAAAAILQVLLAGWGLARLLRECGLGPDAARLGGLAFALSGPLLSLGNLPNLLGSVAWVPVAVWAGLRAQAGSRPALAAAAALTAVPLLAGGLESAAVIVILLALMASPGAGRWRRLGVTGVVAGGAGVLAAAQALPALAALRGSERGLGFRPEQLLHWSMPPARLMEMAVPGLWGTATDPARWWGDGLFDGGVPLLLSVYLGAPVLALAVAGVAALGREGNLPPAVRRLLVATLAVAAGLVLLALGRHNPVLEAAGRLPLAAAWLRYPERLLPLAAPAVAVAAAAGWQVLAGRRRQGRAMPRSAWAGLAAGLALPLGAAALAAAGRLPWAPGLSAPRRQLAATQLGAGAVTAAGAVALLAACLWLAGRRRGARPAAACAGLVVALDLLTAGAGLNPTVEPEVLSEVPAAARAILAGTPPGVRPRLLRQEEPPIRGEGIPPGIEVVWSRRSLSERIPAEFGIGTSLLSDVDRAAPLGNTFLRAAHARATGPARERLADRAGAGWELSFPPTPGAAPPDAVWSGAVFPRAPAVAVRRRPTAGARFQAAPEGVWMGSLADPATLPRLLSALADPGRAPGEAVFLTGPEEGSVAGGWPPGAAPVTVERDRPGDIVLSVTLPGDGVLVARESFVSGWRVSVDGVPRRAARADLAWLGVPLEAGRHRVRLRYRQPGLLPGMALSLAGVVVALALAWSGRRRASVGAVGP